MTVSIYTSLVLRSGPATGENGVAIATIANDHKWNIAARDEETDIGMIICEKTGASFSNVCRLIEVIILHTVIAVILNTVMDFV